MLGYSFLPCRRFACWKGRLFLGFKEIERTSIDETLYVSGRRLKAVLNDLLLLAFTLNSDKLVAEKKN